MLMDALWARLIEAQAAVAGLEAENRVMRLQCRRYLQNWTEARDERDKLLRDKEAPRG